MLLSYSIICFFFFIYSKRLYHKNINPISVYTIIWYTCLFMHELPFAGYYSLTIKTYLTIVITHFVFVLGCIIPKKIKNPEINISFIKRTENEKKKPLEKTLVLLSVIAAVSVLPLFFNILKATGLHLVTNIGKIYAHNVTIESESAFSLSTLTFILSVFSGIYVCKYGFTKYLIIPFIDIVCMALANGSRGTLIILIVLFFAPITLQKKGLFTRKISKKTKKRIVIIALLVFLIVGVLTYSRNTVKGLNLSFIASAFQFVSEYLSSGIACLNEYLKNPVVVSYPQYTLRVPYIFLNKLHLTNIETFFLLDTYYTPQPLNVITYIGELYHDFGEWFYCIVLLMAIIFSKSYDKAVKKDSIVWTLIYSCFFVIFALSFFSNYGHMSPLWIVGLLGVPISMFIDYRIISVSRKPRKESAFY